MEYDIMNCMLSATVSLLFDSVQPNSTSHGTLNAETWINASGKKWLEEAMRRLGLDYSKVSGKQLAGKSAEFLGAEKNRVKNELKHYDANFVLLFQRSPNRVEKEPMRPLYVYYKKLKQALDRCGAQSKPSLGHRQGKQKEEKRPENVERAGSVKAYSEWPFKSNEEIREKIAELKGERAQLRSVLDKFQQDFVKSHNRKIKYNKDIAPVASQFKRYKELKKIIAKLEELL
eukprot:TRINITY_DN1105_c0_g2_i1.p1 TRINITY_DN1105_c0_g2~~TRINITY_DN1105_c0_g2_i1.p1  ORF type:complete len:253 (-),score=85.52 TRINITY_DN1105_c0_g2_i1:152-844(-)